MSPENDQKYKESESAILNLEILSAKYDNLLMQYKQAVADYISYLNSTNSGNKTLTSIKGQAFWGTGQAGTQAAYNDISDVIGCSALCLKTSNCTGATFNPTSYGKPMCWLRTGDGNPVPSKPEDYAIMPSATILLLNIQSINTQLTNVNNQILEKINNSNTLYSDQYEERSQKAAILLANYQKLNDERINIENMVNKYQDLDQAQIQGSIKINENYYSFLLLFALSIFIIIILYKISLSSNSSSSSGSFFNQQGGELGGELGINVYYIILVIIILAIVIYYYSFIMNYTSGVISNISSYIYYIFHF
jgi:hypothetical protein